jgi:hypothetical protein
MDYLSTNRILIKKREIMKKQLFFISIFAILCLNAKAQWQQTSLNYVEVHCLAINGDNIFAGTDGSGVVLSTNNGSSWSVVITGLTSPYIYGLASAGTNTFAGSYNFGVFLSTNSGGNWSAVNNGLPLSGSGMTYAALAIKGTSIFAASAGGDGGNGVYLSSNNGTSWVAVNNGLPFGNGYYPNIRSFAIKEETIFAGGTGVYISSNNGTNWSATSTGIPSGTYVKSLAIGGNNIFAGTSIGNYNGGVYRSSNNGSSWTAVNTGLTGTNVNAIAIYGNYIFAGTGSGVYLSQNNGDSWTAVNTGLTDIDVNALAMNSDYIFAGTTTGGVWKRQLSQLTGIDEINNNENNISVYPNPASNFITISTSLKSELKILNVQGQTILQYSLQQEKTDIDISRLAKGVYILKLKSNNKTEVTMFIKE